MPKNSLDSVLQYLRRIVLTGCADDAQLLEKFARDRDEAAFEKLVLLHGPLVFGLCQRLLRHEQDAEDAFQATFLTLARKAKTIAKKESVAGWLYKVAYRIACRARGRAREATNRMAILERAGGQGDADVLGRELRSVLDEEMLSLGENYRRAILLVCFQGKSLEEAGRRLGCPKATVATWLARGKEKLRHRLGRRGWTLSAAALSAVLTDKSLAVPLPAGLVGSTLVFVSGKPACTGALAAKVLALSDGVLRMMWFNKMKVAVGVVLAVVLAGTGVGLVVRQTWAGGGIGQAGDKEKPRADAQKVGAKADDGNLAKLRRELLQKRAEVAKRVWEGGIRLYQNARVSFAELSGWSERWLDAELSLCESKAERVKALQANLERARAVEQIASERFRAARSIMMNADAATYYRLEAEIRLVAEGVEPQPAKQPKAKP